MRRAEPSPEPEDRRWFAAFMLSPASTGLISTFLLTLGLWADGVEGLLMALCLSYVILYVAWRQS